MDIEGAVADFAASDSINSITDLETALSNLLVVVAKSDMEVSTLLNTLACGVQGLLEAVLLSGKPQETSPALNLSQRHLLTNSPTQETTMRLSSVPAC